MTLELDTATELVDGDKIVIDIADVTNPISLKESSEF